MEIEEALYTTLSTTTNLIALTSTRIYPDLIPQKSEFPAVCFQNISAERVHAFQTDTGFLSKVFQIDSYARTRKESKAVSKQIRLALQNFNGTMGGSGGVSVSAVLILSEIDDYENETQLYSTKMDFEIWFSE